MPSITRSKKHNLPEEDPPKVVAATKKPKSAGKALTKVQQHQILLDIEKHPGCQFKDLLKTYPETYEVGDPIQTAYRNRFNYLKELKKTKPKQYWDLYSKAGKIVLVGEEDETKKKAEGKQQKDTVEDTVEDKAEEDKEEDDDEVQPDEASTISELTSPTFGGPVKKRPVKKKVEPAAANTTPKTKPIIQKKMPSSSSKKSSAASKFGSPSVTSKAKRFCQFENIEEAKSFADESIEVDFDFPEKNGGPLFWVQHVPECRSPDGSELIDKVLIRVNAIMDFSDAHTLKGKTVAYGAGFMLTVPWAPNFMLEHHKKMFKREDKPCDRTRDKHATVANAILKSENPEHGLEPRRFKNVLFVFPNSMIISTKLDSGEDPVADQKITISLRIFTVKKTKVGEGADEEDMPQTYCPGVFEFRVIDEDAESELKRKKKAKKKGQSLKDLFAGMKVNQEGEPDPDGDSSSDDSDDSGSSGATTATKPKKQDSESGSQNGGSMEEDL
ncbi:hypothetical protein SEMRO_412_G137840.1 [Seminavis robusta]|uniref:Uncharacterized protein n=1 Tax=Seminavis robusta TaxID=568900 RepID=A0A9N8DZF2_9STRA|nr:hypothetical protein SEMRO_412_G137840.1 [Seminavis robusta]|eukprot:Sro412_g137840.1 n/a (499) ;mRNA; f:22300-23796